MNRRKIKVAIVGVGNCTSSLIQGVQYYQHHPNPVGAIHKKLGPYALKDIEFVAAFDVDSRKVGKDLSEAILSEPNCTTNFFKVPELGVPVRKSPVLDGINGPLKDIIKIDNSQKPANVSEILKQTGADVVINFLPTGSQKATEFFAQSALDAGAAFVNCIPQKIATSRKWHSKFLAKGVPLLGDDIKSQLGSTFIHRVIMDAIQKRGGTIDNTHQLNIGGNTDFLNMTDRSRAAYKGHTKISALTPYVPGSENVSAGPSGHVPFLKDRKIAYFQINGRKFGGIPFSLNIHLEVEDSPNAAAVAADAIRLAKIARDSKIGGAIHPACGYLFKKPPRQVSDHEALLQLEKFARGQK